jgi:hypothetical protein
MRQGTIEIDTIAMNKGIDYNRLLECFGALVISRLFCGLPQYMILPELPPAGNRVCLQLLTSDGRSLLRFSGENEEECARSLFEAIEQCGLLPASNVAKTDAEWN